MGKVGFRILSIIFLIALSGISNLGSTADGFVGILTDQSMSVLLHLGESTLSVRLGFEHFQPSYEV